MRARIGDFLATKALSANSRAAYTYDLEQFVAVVGNQVTASKLQVYESRLADLKPTAQRRKLSAVNQFLYYLYQEGLVADFYKLKPAGRQVQSQPASSLSDWDILWQETDHKAGQLAALLIWSLGLTPSELLAIRVEDLQLDFQVLTVRKGDLLRVLNLPDRLLPYLAHQLSQVYLFDKKGQPFSRQWLFRTLSAYLTSLNLPALTAQKLREQHILAQLAAGVSTSQLAKNLGLKSPTTLEKYRTHGH